MYIVGSVMWQLKLGLWPSPGQGLPKRPDTSLDNCEAVDLALLPDNSPKLPKGLGPPTNTKPWATSSKDDGIHLPIYFYQIQSNFQVAFQEGNTLQDLNHPDYHSHCFFFPFPWRKLASRPTHPDLRAPRISSGQTRPQGQPKKCRSGHSPSWN